MAVMQCMLILCWFNRAGELVRIGYLIVCPRQNTGLRVGLNNGMSAVHINLVIIFTLHILGILAHTSFHPTCYRLDLGGHQAAGLVNLLLG